MAQGSSKDFLSLGKSTLTLRAGKGFDLVRSGVGSGHPFDAALTVCPVFASSKEMATPTGNRPGYKVSVMPNLQL